MRRRVGRRMRVTRLAPILALAALAAGGCGTTVDDPEPANASDAPSATPTDSAPAEPRLVVVPPAIDFTADEAQAAIEDEGLYALFTPDDPPDASTCVVTDQYPVEGDEVEDGTEVELSTECDVPDVVGLDGQSAVDELEAAGFEWWVDDCEDALEECTVSDQEPSEAEPYAEVSLYMERDEYGDGEYSECQESYPDDCLDPTAYDYDCEGGEGDGPEYVAGPVTVDHSVDDPDPFGLDRDGDGIACEPYYDDGY
jgi:resuscitation-promoting factor RpfB